MTRTRYRIVACVSSGFLICGLLAASAKADITWTIQPASQVGATARLHFPAFDVNDPSNLNPDPNSEGYVPPIEIISIPQTDAGTSGDPALGKAAVNSMLGSGTGFFTTKGNTPTTALNFGNPTGLTPAALTVVGSNVGNFYPSTIASPGAGSAHTPTFTPDGRPIYNFGAAGPVNSAGTLWTQSPLSGFNNLTGNDFSQASRDNGRVAAFGLKALPVSTTAIPVTGGLFDASQLAFQGTLGISLSIALPADPNAIEGASPVSTVIPPEIVGISRRANELVGIASLGAITRTGGGAPNTGPDYLMSIPFSTSIVLTENFDGSNQLSFNLTINVVAKANILPGDVNFDGVVNAADRTIVLQHLGQTSPDHLGVGDANGDGVVNTNDLSLVPEPVTIVGLAMGAVILGASLLRRR